MKRIQVNNNDGKYSKNEDHLNLELTKNIMNRASFGVIFLKHRYKRIIYHHSKQHKMIKKCICDRVP